MNFDPINLDPGRVRYIMPDLAETDSEDNIITEEDEKSRSSVDGLLSTVPTTLEKDEELAKERIQQLYPMIDFEAGPQLPRIWSKYDKFDSLSLSDDGLRVTYRTDVRMKSATNANAASIRANFPIPVRCGVYYFEIRIIRGHKGCMGLGVCARDVQTNRLPGWDRHSYGYHGDDGNFFSASGNGTKYGPNFSTGDVVGCGMNMISRVIFFTKNGKHLGVATRDVIGIDGLYPTIGLQSPGEIVDVNFGQVPFAYDIASDIQAVRSMVYDRILQVELPLEKGDLMKDIVSSWLHTEGFSKTMTSFAKGACLPMEESEENMEKRKAICDLIAASRTSEALSLMEALYPDIFIHNRHVAVMLKAQQFVEMSREFASQSWKKAERSSTNGNSVNRESTERDGDTPGSSQATTSGNAQKRSHNMVSQSTANEIASSEIAVSASNGKDQPCSSRNGDSVANGKTTELDEDLGLEQEDGGDLDGRMMTSRRKEEDEDSEIDEEETSRVMGAIELGREIHDIARQLNLTQEAASFIDESLATLCLSKRGFRGHSLLSRAHLRKMARLANSAILEYHGFLSVSRLEQLTNQWNQKRTELVETDSPVVDFINANKLVFNDDDCVVDSEDDGESDDESDMEAESSEEETSSSGEEDDSDLDEEEDSEDSMEDEEESEEKEDERNEKKPAVNSSQRAVSAAV